MKANPLLTEIRRLRALVANRPVAIDPCLALILTLYFGPREDSGDDRNAAGGLGIAGLWPILCWMKHCRDTGCAEPFDIDRWVEHAEEHPPDRSTKYRIERLLSKWRKDVDWWSRPMREWQIKNGFRNRDGSWQ